MSDKKSEHAALISNVSEKDRAKDVEQFNDILRTFINEMNKFESRFGAIRDEEKMLAVKKLMPESLLNYRFRGTTMSDSEIIIALENIIVDKVSTTGGMTRVLQWRLGWQQKKTEKVRAKKEIREPWILPCRPFTKEQVRENWDSAKVKIGGKGGTDGGKNSWQKGSGKKGGKGQEKGGKGDSRTCWTCGKTGHIAAWCRKGVNKNYTLLTKMTVKESENEQWQEVISKAEQEKGEEGQSTVTVEHGEQSQFKSEEDCGRERQVGKSQSHHGFWSCRPRDARNDEVERKTTPKKFVAADGEQIKDLGEKPIPNKTNEGIPRCITFRSANVVKPFISMQKRRPRRKHCGAGLLATGARRCSKHAFDPPHHESRSRVSSADLTEAENLE